MRKNKAKKLTKPKYVCIVRSARSKHFVTFGFDKASNAKNFVREVLLGGAEAYAYKSM